jgi:hypothetical protein
VDITYNGCSLTFGLYAHRQSCRGPTSEYSHFWKCLKTPNERGSKARLGRGGAKHAPIFLIGWGLT